MIINVVKIPAQLSQLLNRLKPYQQKLAENLKGNRSLWIIIVAVLLIIAALPSYYYYSQYKKTQQLLNNPSATANAEAKQLIIEVGKLMVLPTVEQPTVATVSDVTKLIDQPFFANAKNGDKVLIYTQSKKAILYRESINKIVEVAPVNLGSNTPAAAPVVTAPTLAPTVAPTFAPTQAPVKAAPTIINQ